MAEKITMPRLSDTMEEGTLVKWHKNVGDTVAEGDILAEIETDKAIQEFESEFDGVLLFQGVEEGKAAPVDAILAVIGEKGEKFDAAAETTPAEQEVSKPTESKETPVAKSAKNAIPKEVKVINMPRLSDTMEEGTVATWHKSVGDAVAEGDILAEIETDKAVQEFESEYDGTLLYIGAEEGKAAPVDTILAIIGPKGFDVSDILAGNTATEETTETTEKTEEKITESTPVEQTSSSQNQNSRDRIFASPLAKSLAQEKGIDLTQIIGSGDQGRIVKKDVENFQPQAASAKTITPSVIASKKDQTIPNSQMRKVIAKRLSASKFTAPHYYLNVEVNMDNCILARKQMNESQTDSKVSFNDIIVKAVALALRKHPQVNSTWQDDATLIHGDINIGVAVAVDDGLLVPVIKNTDFMSFSEISTAVKDLATRARDRKLKADEMEGSTFTVSNLGMFGIKSFTSIINQPNSSILSVGAIVQKPIVKDGQIVVGNTMELNMACDHRTVDGATGAQFLQTLVKYLENPIAMFV